MDYYTHLFEVAIFTQDEESYIKINKELEQLSNMFSEGYFLKGVFIHPWLSSVQYEGVRTPISHISLYHKTPYKRVMPGLRKELTVIDDGIEVSEDDWRDTLSAFISEYDGRVILLSDFLKLPMEKYLSALSDYQKHLYLDLMANSFLVKNGIPPIYEVREHWSRMYSNDYNKYLEYIGKGDNTDEEHL